MIRPLLVLSLAALLGARSARAQEAAPEPRTFCNPLDLPYRFQLEAPSRREAADPTLVRFHGSYWLFASKSGGYWRSRDLLAWTFVVPTGLPLEDYAPTVQEIGGRLYYTAFSSRAVYATDDPATGAWTKVAAIKDYADPDLFLDDDGRLYMYSGCSDRKPITVVELDPRNFQEIGAPVPCLQDQSRTHGWELFGELNRGNAPADGMDAFRPWIEGAWMTKHAGRYYLQYSGPGTQFRSYSDGVVVGDSPKGPFTYAPYSPFSSKPTGFIAGAGHSSTLEDAGGRYWHIVSQTISVKHIFERRLGLYPAGFEADGELVTNTYLGDYPQLAPGGTADPAHGNSAGWMLLDLRKPAAASSELPGHPAALAFDEDIRTWWSAATGNAGEWLGVDFGRTCRVDAVQVNFAEQDSTTLGRLSGDIERYHVEASLDGATWFMLVDRSANTRDAPHEYLPLAQPATARYLRIVNLHTPAGAKFSLSGLRAFGSGLGMEPQPVEKLLVSRDPTDGRHAVLKWTPSARAQFYIVRFGQRPDRLTHNYQVYDGTGLELNSLNAGVPYIFTVDAVNENGVTPGAGQMVIN